MNVERTDRMRKQADRLDTLIRERGYALPESVMVHRGGFFEGWTDDKLEDLIHEGQMWEEKGFTSTMLGPANGRLEMYPAGAKADLEYARTGKANDTIPGAAVIFDIALPKGTRVASVEAGRRVNKFRDGHVYNQLTPSKNSRESILAYRTESEVLLGSGARFRVKSITRRAGVSKYFDLRIPYTRVVMEYIGGGSSQS